MKRMLSVLVSIAMLLSLAVVPASAASVPTVTVQSVDEAKPGETVTLEVTIADNPGFTNFEWHIDYDDSRLELKSINTFYVDEDEEEVDYINRATVIGNVATKFVGCIRDSAFKKDSVLFTLTFNVKDTAAGGNAAVTITSDKFENGATDPITTISATYVAGGVTVAHVHTYGNLIAAQPAVHTQTELKAAVAAHYLCDCGTYFTEGKVETTLEALTGEAPTHSYGKWVNTDAAKHWKECSCGLKTEENNHDYDNDTDVACNTCGYNRDVHVCSGTIVEGHAATCTVDGWKAYYQCSCEKLYTDETCQNEIPDLIAWKNGDGKIAAGHTYGELIEAQVEVHTQTELKAAVAAHYHCVCGAYFTAEKATTTLESLTGETPSHSYGGWVQTNEEHWKECDTCGLKTEEATHAYADDVDTTCDCGYVRTIEGGEDTGGSTVGGSTTGGSTTGGSTTGGSTTGGVSIIIKTEGNSSFAAVEVTDQEVEKIVEDLSNSGGNLTLDLERFEQETLALPGNLVEALADSSAQSGVTVTTENASISISDEVLDTVADAMVKEDIVSLQMIMRDASELNPEQQEALESNTDHQIVIMEVKLVVIDAEGTVKKDITELGGNVDVTIQCSPEMQGKDVIACYISDEGEITVLDSQYDATTNTLSFTTVHFSVYAAMERSATGGSTTGGSTTGGSTTGGSTTGGSTTGGSTTGGSTTGGSTTGGSTTGGSTTGGSTTGGSTTGGSTTGGSTTGGSTTDHPVINHTGEADHETWTYQDDGETKTVTVTHEEACVVIIQLADGTFASIEAVENADGSYDFDVSGMMEGTNVVIAKKGDTDLDGQITMSDATSVMNAWVNNDEISVITKFVADVNASEELDMSDAASIMNAWVNDTGFSW